MKQQETKRAQKQRCAFAGHRNFDVEALGIQGCHTLPYSTGTHVHQHQQAGITYMFSSTQHT